MNLKQPFDHAIIESEQVTAVLHQSFCRSFRLGAQECREMLARFVEQGGDAVTQRLEWLDETANLRAKDPSHATCSTQPCRSARVCGPADDHP